MNTVWSLFTSQVTGDHPVSVAHFKFRHSPKASHSGRSHPGDPRVGYFYPSNTSGKTAVQARQSVKQRGTSSAARYRGQRREPAGLIRRGTGHCLYGSNPKAIAPLSDVGSLSHAASDWLTPAKGPRNSDGHPYTLGRGLRAGKGTLYAGGSHPSPDPTFGTWY